MQSKQTRNSSIDSRPSIEQQYLEKRRCDQALDVRESATSFTDDYESERNINRISNRGNTDDSDRCGCLYCCANCQHRSNKHSASDAVPISKFKSFSERFDRLEPIKVLSTHTFQVPSIANLSSARKPNGGRHTQSHHRSLSNQFGLNGDFVENNGNSNGI